MDHGRSVTPLDVVCERSEIDRERLPASSPFRLTAWPLDIVALSALPKRHVKARSAERLTSTARSKRRSASSLKGLNSFGANGDIMCRPGPWFGPILVLKDGEFSP